jgi:hypothetical protein
VHDDDQLYIEPVEGYCVRCRETVDFENPVPVWTRKGLPATRGECPNCGGVVFRLGKTDAHDGSDRPEAVEVAGKQRLKLAQETIYINYAPADEEIAEQLAADLQKVGVAVWLHEAEPTHVNWAGGVHPALKECARMVLVLSPDAIGMETVEAAWRFFREKSKPVLIAQVAPADPPDAVRRSPRFDFAADYRAAFRQLVQSIQ